MSKSFYLLMAILGTYISGFASDDVVRLLAKTNSTKTLMINKGLYDGIKAQDKGHFILIQKDNSQLNLGPAEAVKVYNGYSIWYLKNKPEVELIENQQLYLREMGEFFKAQPELKVNRQRIIGPRKNIEKILTKKDTNFEKGLEIEEKDIDPVEKILLDQSEWNDRENFNEEKQAVPNETAKNISTPDFKKVVKEKRFDDLVVGETKEQNSNPVDLERLHPDTKKRGGDESVYKALVDDHYQRKLRAEEAISHQERKGESWSDDMSDRELINFVKKNGIAHEKERRLYIMSKLYSMEATFAMGFKLNDSTTTEDSTTKNELTRDFAFNLEYFLGVRYQTLDHFSIEGEFRKAESIAAVSTQNARVNSTTLGANVYWYPFTYPTELAKNLFFVGLGFKKGTSNVATSRASQSYSVNIFPVMSAGIRYHFEQGLGLRLMTSMESLSLTPVDSTIQTTDSLPNTVSFYDMKIIGGISYYF